MSGLTCIKAVTEPPPLPPHQDSQHVVESYKSGFEPPGDVDFEDYGQAMTRTASDASLTTNPREAKERPARSKGKLWPFIKNKSKVSAAHGATCTLLTREGGGTCTLPESTVALARRPSCFWGDVGGALALEMFTHLLVHQIYCYTSVSVRFLVPFVVVVVIVVVVVVRHPVSSSSPRLPPVTHTNSFLPRQ